ncbi:MAG: ABC transporter ATP-binding protein, partial [Flavobacteriales bacterium]|nr:ABC transporter ATP-binding protein [Flavobacteriales bacterium]
MSKQKISLAKVFKTIIWPRKKLVLIGLLLIFISRISGLILPGASKFLIDDVIQKQNFELLKILLLVVSIAIIIQSISSFLLTKIISV